MNDMFAPICPIHHLEAVWKEGVSKTTKKPYAFFSCPIKKEQNGGEYCSHKFDKPTNGQKFEGQLNASVQAQRQDNKDALITRTAVVKSLIERGDHFNVASVKEAQQWVNWIEGKSVTIPTKAETVGIGEEEIDVQSIPF